MKLKNNVLAGTFTLALPLLFPIGAQAQADNKPQDSNVFTLGQITVTGQREDEPAIATSTLSSEEMRDFTKESLKEALDIIPGVSIKGGSGNRNEPVISVRGFHWQQVPLYMDGIRLYLPADNRIDFDRFLTLDLSEIQVSKGYVSVLNGPDGMGGAINLTTRKPAKPLEAEANLSAKLGEGGQYEGYTAYTNVGGKQNQFYWQASFEQRKLDDWRLSHNFKPTVAENGGRRNNTDKKDWRANLKAGFTPNATDEYSLNFVKQEGEKHGIGAVTGTSAISRWDWPKWDVWSLYWLSHTQLGEKSYVKTKAYYNSFDNDLFAYRDDAYTIRNFQSHYDDNAKGVSLEFGTDLLPMQTLKAALHFRRDEHKEWQDSFNAANIPTVLEPKQKNLEDRYSFALEDTVHITPQFDLVGGWSRDIRRTKKAEEFVSPNFVHFDLADMFATNWQGAAIWRYREGGKVNFSVSRVHRFPTMFERFSTRFASAISNPYLKPERALNFELGFSDRIYPGVYMEAALFHNKVKDAINWHTSYAYGTQSNGDPMQKSVNLGEATFKGLEVALHAQVMPTLSVGGNYTYIKTKVDDPNIQNYKLTSTPRHQAFLYAKWKPVNDLSVIPSFEYGGTRWSDPPSGTGYVRAGNFRIFNLKADYQLDRHWDVSLAVRNLFDKNYELSSGYPEEGRSFLLSTRYQF